MLNGRAIIRLAGKMQKAMDALRTQTQYQLAVCRLGILNFVVA
jgi:hypothetical protein